MDEQRDGGPAFPRPVSATYGENGMVFEAFPGLSLRDYFIAHAPAEPQPWFEPHMPKKPTVPHWTDIADHVVREDVRRAMDYETDPYTDAGREFQDSIQQARNEVDLWTVERAKQRYIQWPAAWADAMLSVRQRQEGK